MHGSNFPETTEKKKLSEVESSPRANYSSPGREVGLAEAKFGFDGQGSGCPSKG